MDDDMRDELPVPHYEDELWHALAREHAEQRRIGALVPPPPEVADVRARRGARRMVLAGIGSIAAAAVALAAVVVTGADDSTDPGSTNAGSPDTEAAETTPTTATPEVSLAAQITAATEEASESSIIHTRRDNQYVADGGTPIGDEEEWTDEQSGARRTLAYDSEGEPAFDTGRATAPDVDDPGPPPIPPDAPPFDPSLPQERLRQVDHCFGEYAEYDQTAIPGHNEADRLGEWLDDGTLVEDGTETVDGRELIRLVQVPVELQPPRDGERVEAWLGDDPATSTTAPATDPESGELDPDTFEYVEHIYLVDAETFRPVRVIGYPGEAPDYSDATYVATIDYLPRTPENMALLSAPTPDGFELVGELRGDGERLDQCGW